VSWLATTPEDVHEAPQTAGQALASLLTGGKTDERLAQIGKSSAGHVVAVCYDAPLAKRMCMNGRALCGSRLFETYDGEGK
jgi:hypothetical protein